MRSAGLTALTLVANVRYAAEKETGTCLGRFGTVLVIARSEAQADRGKFAIGQ